ncbi:PAAR domain-containing protein [Iodobacter sp. LRB]|uniref:PAAR domain-containing protein n=1 Tax=unclassified Iodobacter TaxID=235634 RepID=UPI00211DE424|nr:PAAR domain-containing protein [Iodobacter sp. BJB302]
MKKVIRLGDQTSHGGVVLSGASTTNMFGKPLALTAAILIFAASLANAEAVYDGYDSYYASLPGAIFHADAGYEMQPLSTGQEIKYAWEGVADGRKQRVVLDTGRIQINGRCLTMQSAVIFPNEHSNRDDFGRGTSVYFSKDFTCLESVSPSASGSAVRHTAVHLIGNKPKSRVFIKLPSLFASCKGVRLNQQGGITFDKVEYRYEKNADFPSGVTFTEYTSDGKKFYKSDKQVTAKFIDPENVYQFVIEKAAKD